MPMAVLSNFLIYCVINAFTPGPGNILALNTVTNYGYKKGKPLFFGIFAGYYVVQILCAIFVYGVSSLLPNVMEVMKYIGAAYILWLAIHIAFSKPSTENAEQSASFLKGFMLQFVNVKMEYIRITKENIDKEHICCAMSGKQSLAKKEWLKQRFEEGLVFYRSAERGKCFIEYIPAENAWVPIDATGWLYINCLWVSGSLKGHGYSSDLLEECLRDAKAQGKNGVCILCAEGRKREFLADPKFLTHKGFKVSDISDCGINLMYLPLAENARPPKFKDCAKHPKVEENGFVLYYTDQCPYTYYWVPKVQEAAKEHGIPFKAVHITEKETAQNVPVPVTTYALFRDGKFVTQSIQSDKKFLKLAAE